MFVFCCCCLFGLVCSFVWLVQVQTCRVKKKQKVGWSIWVQKLARNGANWGLARVWQRIPKPRRNIEVEVYNMKRIGSQFNLQPVRPSAGIGRSEGYTRERSRKRCQLEIGMCVATDSKAASKIEMEVWDATYDEGTEPSLSHTNTQECIESDYSLYEAGWATVRRGRSPPCGPAALADEGAAEGALRTSRSAARCSRR